MSNYLIFIEKIFQNNFPMLPLYNNIYNPSHNWHDLFFILPEIQLTFFICVILIFFSIIINQKNKKYSVILDLSNSISIFGLLLILLFSKSFLVLNFPLLLFNQSFFVSPFTIFFKKIIIMSTIIVLYVSKNLLEEQHNNFCEYYILILCMTLGAIVTISSNDFLLMYIGLEIQALSSYVLTCLGNTPMSAEAGLKYVLTGSFSSTFILFGISLIVYALGTHNFNQIMNNTLIINYSYLSSLHNFILTLGIFSLIIGFLIKLGVAPFHLWLPDIYEGALLPVTLYFATVQKLVTFIIFIRLFGIIFVDLFYIIQPILIISSVISIITGTLICVSEMKIKRFLAYSSITHMGFLLMGLSVGGTEGIQASLTYFIVYYILTFGAWYSITIIKVIVFENNQYREKFLTNIDDFGYFIKNKPMLGLIIGINFLSMGGIPPLVGFASKTVILNAVINNLLNDSNIFVLKFQSIYFFLLLVACASNVVSALYYVRFLKEVYTLKSFNLILENSKIFDNLLLGSLFFFNIVGILIFPKILNFLILLSYNSL